MCLDLTKTRPAATTTPARKERKKKKKARAAPVAPVAPAPRPFAYARNVDALLREFEQATLPREDWTHAAHLVVALAYAHRDPVDAYERLREGIRAYNRATGAPETPTRGYHETITRAWFHLVLHFLDVFDDGRALPDLAADLVELYGRDELFVHFSRERLLSPEARAGWVEPDLRALPPLLPFSNQDRRFVAGLEARLASVTPVAAVGVGAGRA